MGSSCRMGSASYGVRSKHISETYDSLSALAITKCFVLFGADTIDIERCLRTAWIQSSWIITEVRCPSTRAGRGGLLGPIVCYLLCPVGWFALFTLISRNRLLKMMIYLQDINPPTVVTFLFVNVQFPDTKLYREALSMPHEVTARPCPHQPELS